MGGDPIVQPLIFSELIKLLKAAKMFRGTVHEFLNSATQARLPFPLRCNSAARVYLQKNFPPAAYDRGEVVCADSQARHSSDQQVAESSSKVASCSYK